MEVVEPFAATISNEVSDKPMAADGGLRGLLLARHVEGAIWWTIQPDPPLPLTK